MDDLCLHSQVILKQQRVIKRLLKKCHGEDICAGGVAGEKDTADEDNVIKMLASDVAAALGVGNSGGKRVPDNADALAVHTGNNKTALENRLATEFFDGQNDSDSAIMLEDHLTDVGIFESPLRK